MLFVMKKRSKIYIILVCKTHIDGVMVVKLGKIVYLFTQHVHTTLAWKSLPHLFLKIYPLKCFFFMYKWSKIILVCKLYIYRAMDLKLGKLVYIITKHILVHFQLSIA